MEKEKRKVDIRIIPDIVKHGIKIADMIYCKDLKSVSKKIQVEN